MIKFEYLKNNSNGIQVAGKEVIFSSKVRWAFSRDFSDIIIVKLHQFENKPDENIYGVNDKGEIVWELNKGNYLKLAHGFRKDYVDKNHDLWVENYGGVHYKIDHKTGKVIGKRYKEIQYRFEKNSLYVKDRKIDFKNKIEEVLVHKGLLIVLLDTNDSDGIFCVSKEGKILWTIRKANVLENVPLAGPSVGAGIIQRDKKFAYLLVEKKDYGYDPEGDLWAYQWGDLAYRLDHKTGKILEAKVWR